MSVAAAIKERREALGLTHKQLAERLEQKYGGRYEVSYLRKLERESYTPLSIIALCEVLDTLGVHHPEQEGGKPS